MTITTIKTNDPFTQEHMEEFFDSLLVISDYTIKPVVTELMSNYRDELLCFLSDMGMNDTEDGELLLHTYQRLSNQLLSEYELN